MKHHVCAVSDLEVGRMRILELGGRSVGVVKAGGEIYAVLNICPHALAPVCEGRLTGTMIPSRPGEAVWGLDGRVLRCPWHGYEFDLGSGGQTVFTTFKARLRMFPVTVEAGEVYVDIPERRQIGQDEARQGGGDERDVTRSVGARS